jgi:hypothetical protein
MAKRMTVEEHYTRGRTHPYGRVIDDGAEDRIERHPSMESKGPALRNNRPQDPEDAHGPGYDGDASGWVRGARGEPTGHDETAEGKPSFDHSPPRNKMRR